MQKTLIKMTINPQEYHESGRKIQKNQGSLGKGRETLSQALRVLVLGVFLKPGTRLVSDFEALSFEKQ